MALTELQKIEAQNALAMLRIGQQVGSLASDQLKVVQDIDRAVAEIKANLSFAMAHLFPKTTPAVSVHLSGETKPPAISVETKNQVSVSLTVKGVV